MRGIFPSNILLNAKKPARVILNFRRRQFLCLGLKNTVIPVAKAELHRYPEHLSKGQQSFGHKRIRENGNAKICPLIFFF
jgi:hypothetical protein